MLVPHADYWICCSVTKLCPTLCNLTDCRMPWFSVLHYLPKFAQIHIHWVGDAVQPFHPLPPPSPFVLSLSSIKVFSNEWTLHIRWPKYWSFSFSISPSNEYSGLISFRIDWFELLDAQKTLKSLFQHHNLKAFILRHSAFFMAQLSHPYMTAGKSIALTRQIFVAKRGLHFLRLCLVLS